MKNFFFFFFSFTVLCLPQSISLNGRVLSNKDSLGLSSANIFLASANDSVIYGCKSGKDGFFSLEKIKKGSYTLTIKYLGYSLYSKQIQVIQNKNNLGSIYLTPEAVVTQEIVISENVQKVTRSGDTLIYNAKGFKINNDAAAEDLLTKIPGVTVEDGKLKAQGEDVKKVYVDGKSFFGDDPNAAIKNLPADIIEKIQIFDKQSEQSVFTGFDDGSTTKAINIITSLNIQNGSFGKINAGYGTDSKYNASLNANYFNEKRRISIISQLNNTNEQNFSGIDLLGMIPSGKGGEQGPPPGDFSQSLFTSGSEGINTTKAAGINYNDNPFQSLDLGASYFFNNSDKSLNSNTSRIYNSSDFLSNYTESTRSQTGNLNHRFNIQLSYDIDSLNSIRFIPGFSFQKSNYSSFTNAVMNSKTGLLSSSQSSNYSDKKGFNFNSLLMFSHKFNNKGRSIAFTLNTNFKDNNGIENLYSNSYYSTGNLNEIIDRKISTDNYSKSISAGVIYSEPLNRCNTIMFNANSTISSEDNNKSAFNYSSITSGYSLFDTSSSSDYNKKYNTNSVGAGYRYKKGSISFNLNLSYNISNLNSEHTYPYSNLLKKNFYSFLPGAILRASLNNGDNIEAFYRSFNNAPSVANLQEAVNATNPLQITTGNPSLKQETGHFAAIHYSSVNYSNMNSLFIMIGGMFKSNYIGSAVYTGNDSAPYANIFLKKGTKLTLPVNLSGYYSLNSFATYGIPVNWLSSNINFDLSFNYSRTPGLLDNKNYLINSYTYGAGLTLSSNISTSLDFEISSRSSLNNNKSNSSTYISENYFSQNSYLKFYSLLFDRVVFKLRLNHKYIDNVSNGNKPNIVTLNTELGVKVFSDKSGEVKFSVNDLLNNNNNIAFSNYENYSQEYSTNTTGRYYLLSFNYNLRIFNL